MFDIYTGIRIRAFRTAGCTGDPALDYTFQEGVCSTLSSLLQKLIAGVQDLAKSIPGGTNISGMIQQDLSEAFGNIDYKTIPGSYNIGACSTSTVTATVCMDNGCSANCTTQSQSTSASPVPIGSCAAIPESNNSAFILFECGSGGPIPAPVPVAAPCTSRTQCSNCLIGNGCKYCQYGNGCVDSGTVCHGSGNGSLVLELTRQCSSSNAEINSFLNSNKVVFVAAANNILTSDGGSSVAGARFNDIQFNTNGVYSFVITSTSSLSGTGSTFCLVVIKFFETSMGVLESSRISCNSSSLVQTGSKRFIQTTYQLTGSMSDVNSAPTGHGGLSAGASAGIAIAVIVAVIIIASVILFLVVSCNKNQNDGYRSM